MKLWKVAAFGALAWWIIRSYSNAVDSLTIAIKAVRFGNISSGALQLQVDLLITNPSVPPLYITSAALQLFFDNNGVSTHIADLATGSITLLGNSAVTVPTNATLDTADVVAFAAALVAHGTNPINVSITGSIYEGTVAIPVSLTNVPITLGPL